MVGTVVVDVVASVLVSVVICSVVVSVVVDGSVVVEVVLVSVVVDVLGSVVVDVVVGTEGKHISLAITELFKKKVFSKLLPQDALSGGTQIEVKGSK